MSVNEKNLLDKSQLKKLREKILAGKAASDEESFNDLLEDFSSVFKNFVKNESEFSYAEVIPEISNSINASFQSQTASDLAAKIDPDNFYDFGEKLLNLDSETEFDTIQELIFAYLNLFRLSDFLKRIYKQRKWDNLIYQLIDKSKFTTAALFEQRRVTYPNKTLFKVIHGKSETNYSWDTSAEQVAAYRRSFFTLMDKENLSGEKIAFLMDNSIYMAMLDIACLTSGIVNIMIPANSVPQHILFILNQSEAPLVVVSDEKQLAKIKSIKTELTFLKTVILLQGRSAEDWVYSFNEFLALDNESSEQMISESLSKIKPKSLATIMYTSGTTGEPKGIMFSHMNIVSKRFYRAMALPLISSKDKFLAYLPLYHTFGRWLEMMGSIFWGAEYTFMENPSVDTMISNMEQTKPSIFISIPKKWSQLFEYISARVDLEMDEIEVIKEKVKEVTGGNLRWGLSAAGFLPPEVFTFFQKNGVELMSGFGMTEATGGITMTPPGEYIPNSLGESLPGIEIKLAEDGELLIRGPYVMIGYFDETEEETFSDGWFATGDIMRMDENNFIEIIDRKKEIYKNIKGETVAPQRIENYFKDFKSIKQVFLAGDHRPFNTLLIYPDLEEKDSLISRMTIQQRQEYFSSVIVTVNNFLAPFERIVDFKIIKEPFSAEKGELTPKNTYKRRVIEKNYAEEIESMYSKNHTEIFVGGIEVWIPNWFLREKGALIRDLIAIPNGITIPKLQIELKIERCKDTQNYFIIGDFVYKISTKHIDLQPFFTNPVYWLGNQSLVSFTREAIYQWYRQFHKITKVEFSHTLVEKSIIQQQREEMKKILGAGEQSLNGLHLAAQMLQSADLNDGYLAAQYIKYILEDENLHLFNLAYEILFRPALIDQLPIRREIFKIAAAKISGEDFQRLMEIYLDENYDLFDEAVIRKLVDERYSEDIIEIIEFTLRDYVEKFSSEDDLSHSPIPSLFNLLAAYGIQHPTKYQYIRQIISKYQLSLDFPQIGFMASGARTKMRDGFRSWLGANQSVAVDMETGEEYQWKDVVITEPDMDDEDRDRIIKALTETSILREALFLFSKGKLIRLDNILPGGVWISHLRSYHDKSVYRVSVQTRYQGSFDIVLNLNKELSAENVKEEVNWLIMAGSRYFIQELIEDFGGYWEEYDMWSGKFVPGDTVARFLMRESRKNDNLTQRKLHSLWPFFVWNAAAAYINFWKLTNHQLKLSDPSTNNFLIPTHDYQTGTKVVSFSERIKSESMVDLFNNFYEKFVLATEEQYFYLKKISIWNYIFSGVINAEGERVGVEILKEFKNELKNSELNYRDDVLIKLNLFLKTLEEDGFIPKQLFFAIKRFHRWFLLNEDAALEAQAEMLYELYETYHLSELEKNYPETRTRFFLETAFSDSSKDLKNLLYDIVKNQHKKELSHDETLALLSNIPSEFELDNKESFFLTRLSYPHLKPSDSAALLKTRSGGTQSANLVVEFEDYDGAIYYIRKPNSPKEISRLHQLFIDTNLLVHFRIDHNYLVAVSERGFIIGGLFYVQTDEQTVHMEKIVVSNRYRRKGISEGLMNEFFNRMKDEHIKFITTGFFRPEYFYRFGFSIERKYSGLVKELKM